MSFFSLISLFIQTFLPFTYFDAKSIFAADPEPTGIVEQTPTPAPPELVQEIVAEPTAEPTEAPSPTAEPTSIPTEAPTSAPVEAPTETPIIVVEPTSTPVESTPAPIETSTPCWQ